MVSIDCPEVGDYVALLKKSSQPKKPGDIKYRYIIFKIPLVKKLSAGRIAEPVDVVVEEASEEDDYEVFRNKLIESKTDKGEPAARYALYDVPFTSSGGAVKSEKTVFILWTPENSPTEQKMTYGLNCESFKDKLSVIPSLAAHDPDEIEWEALVDKAKQFSR
ncbi:hypothetical protein AJ80_02800 [Polytolypa hystricis UAMH7299]|uniref:Cofilin n=1 Tax=Polytolypa hystricis (strain UAMH7299) TaxID=1447883 RepID=A0A2B7YGF1_POLH7|nr:hypothetical protein AJ80_02800 [Polytolypa hystricis UAMH7299]